MVRTREDGSVVEDGADGQIAGPVARDLEDEPSGLVGADRAVRAREMLRGGVEALLSTLGPSLRWRPPHLEAEYPLDRELRLDGRGLLLVPSVFCWQAPITLTDPRLPPVLVYPVARTHHWWLPQQAGAGPRTLGRLIGQGGPPSSRHWRTVARRARWPGARG
ncbi:hypothetical protein [Streptomyces sp. NPDC057199]|uniref:hypothetical protein n=1 Tax=Streptomyces sp. NPDC057199 TaxID=3346047 RepID=UPI0036302CC3